MVPSTGDFSIWEKLLFSRSVPRVLCVSCQWRMSFENPLEKLSVYNVKELNIYSEGLFPEVQKGHVLMGGSPHCFFFFEKYASFWVVFIVALPCLCWAGKPIVSAKRENLPDWSTLFILPILRYFHLVFIYTLFLHLNNWIYFLTWWNDSSLSTPIFLWHSQLN